MDLLIAFANHLVSLLFVFPFFSLPSNQMFRLMSTLFEDVFKKNNLSDFSKIPAISFIYIITYCILITYLLQCMYFSFADFEISRKTTITRMLSI